MEDIFYTNGFGIKIKKCCASCKYKQIDNRLRVCTAGEGMVSPTSYCINWTVADNLENAGKGKGKVKTAKYLQFILKKMDVNDDKKNSLTPERVSIVDIRNEYVKQNGNKLFEDI